MKNSAVGRLIGVMTGPLRAKKRNKARVFDPAKVRSVLIVKTDHLGDLMTAAPAVYAIRKIFTSARITLAGTTQGAKLYRALGLIDDEVTLDDSSRTWKRITTIRALRFDLVVNLRHDFRDILFASILKGEFYCTYDHKGLGAAATHPEKPPSEDVYESENHLSLVSALGVPPLEFEVPIDPAADIAIRKRLGNKKWAVLHPIARTAAKQWPIANFKSLVDRLDMHGVSCVCVGAREDRDACARVLGDRNRGLNLAGDLSFAELFALQKHAAMFVGVDSFVMHAAYFCGLAGVAIFSGTNSPVRWAPPGMIVVRNIVPCEPCRRDDCNVTGHPCLDDLTVDQVDAALIQLMDREKL